MAEFIKPTTVSQIRGHFGYTVLIERKGQSGTVEKELSLGSVIDVSWTKAKELEELLEKFLEDEGCIILDDMKVLQTKIGFAQKRKENLTKQLKATEDVLVRYADTAHRLIMEKSDE